MNTKNNFNKIYLLLSFIAFIILLLVSIFLYKEIYDNNQKAEQSMIEAENETSRREDIKLVNNSIKKITEDKALLETHFARSSDIVPFLETIELLAKKVGVKVGVDSVDVVKGNTALNLQINASGAFDQLYKFLTLLENSPYETEFTLVNMDKEAKAEVLDEAGIPKKTTAPSKWRAVIGMKLLTFVQ